MSLKARSGPPQQVSATPVARSSPSTLGAHPLSFSSLPFPQFSPSSPHPSPVLASLPIPLPPLPSLPALLASLHSLRLHLRQVAQCSVPCPFLPDITCHYVSLCRSLIFLPPPSFLFPSATVESSWDPGVFIIIIIIIFPSWWLSYDKHSISLFAPPKINHGRLAHCRAVGSSCLVLAHPIRLPGCYMHAPTLYYNSRFGPWIILCALFQSFVHVYSPYACPSYFHGELASWTCTLAVC